MTSKTAIVITSWWNGSDVPLNEIDRSKYKSIICNCCSRVVEKIFYPVEWDDVEFVCEECVIEGEMEGES